MGFSSTPNSGATTKMYSGTVTTTPINLPSVAGNNIIEAFVKNPSTNVGAAILLYSYDGGNTYHELTRTSWDSWDIKGDVAQIQIKAFAGTINYEVKLNIEAS